MPRKAKKEKQENVFYTNYGKCYHPLQQGR